MIKLHSTPARCRGTGRYRLWPLLWGCLGVCLSLDALAIMTRHDRTDARYRVTTDAYPQVFYLHERYGNKVCVATLIAADWALTAAHCALQTPIAAQVAAGESYALTVAERPNAVSEVHFHPDFTQGDSQAPRGVDLALLRLAQPVAVPPVPLLRGSEAPGQEIMILGWGYSGVGTRGRQYNDGRLRRAHNRVAHVGDWMEFVFNDPRAERQLVHELEGMPGLGDSGGPALIELDGEWYLAGVARGELTSEGEGHRQGRYGAVAMYERVSLHRDWIDGLVQGRVDE